MTTSVAGRVMPVLSPSAIQLSIDMVVLMPMEMAGPMMAMIYPMKLHNGSMVMAMGSVKTPMESHLTHVRTNGVTPGAID